LRRADAGRVADLIFDAEDLMTSQVRDQTARDVEAVLQAQICAAISTAR
jgi:hypothetical protein